MIHNISSNKIIYNIVDEIILQLNAFFQLANCGRVFALREPYLGLNTITLIALSIHSIDTLL